MTARQTRNLFGITLMLISGAMLTSVDSISKVFVETYTVSQILFVQSLCALAALLAFCAARGKLRLLRVQSARQHITRGLLYVVGSYAFLTALRFLPLADAVAISFASPIIIAALSPMYLGEASSRRRTAAVLIGFLGVLVMLRPGSANIHWAVLLPLLVAIVDSFRDLLTRRLTITETSQSLIFYTTATVTVISCPMAVTNWSPIPAAHVGLFVGAGVMFIGAHYFMVEAFRHGEASVVSPYRYFMLVWSTLAGFLLWGDLPHSWMIVGAVLTIGSGVYMLLLESKR
jgi:drug/metabolite transporter (DMT)-like permease